jgi:rod shape-determining protein MreD
MYILIFVFALFLAFVLQLTVVPLFAIYHTTPDLVLIVLIIITLQKGRFWGIVFGFLSGLIIDILSNGLVGLSSLSYAVAAFVTGFLRSEQLERRASVVAGVLFLGLFVHHFIYYLVLQFGSAIGFVETIFSKALPYTIYSMVFVLILHLLLPRLLWGRSGRNH